MERKVKKGNGQWNPAVRKMRRVMTSLIRDVTTRIVNRRFVERCMELTRLPEGLVLRDIEVPEKLLTASCKRALRLLDFMSKKAWNEKEVKSVAADVLGYIPCLVDDNLSEMVTDQMIWSLVSRAYVEMYEENFVLNHRIHNLRSPNRMYEPRSIKDLSCYGNCNGGDPNCLLCDDQQACSQERVNIAS